MIHNPVFISTVLVRNLFQEAVVAEWLRRLTRNQIPSGSAGSSPADRDKVIFVNLNSGLKIEIVRIGINFMI